MKLRSELRQEIGREEILTSLFMRSNQEFKSQRFQLHQARRWTDKAQRDNIRLHGELELRSWVFCDDSRDFHEIEELRRIRRRNRSSWTIKNLWIVRAPREQSYDRESIMTQTREFQSKVNSFVRRKRILWSWIRGQVSIDRHSRSSLYFSESLNGTSITGIVFERLLAQERLFSTIFHNLQQFKEIGTLLSGLRRDTIETKRKETMKWSVVMFAQVISCSNVHVIFPVHERFLFCLVQMSTSFVVGTCERRNKCVSFSDVSLLFEFGFSWRSFPDFEGVGGHVTNTME